MDSQDPQGDLLPPANSTPSETTPETAPGTAPDVPADTPSEVDPEVEALWAHVYRLQTVMAAALVALVFLSLGIILFMGKQMTTLRARLAVDRQTAQRMYTDFQSNFAPKVRGFVRSLETFAATNQNFTPILEKYRSVLSPYFAPAQAAPAQTGSTQAAPAPPKTPTPSPAAPARQ
ncbi:MAG: hypothetical protein JXQ71_12910 [Verrucomicrobia bacterium]|nr:hypothetical protein [Verrucomicrobiota bacterium]